MRVAYTSSGHRYLIYLSIAATMLYSFVKNITFSLLKDPLSNIMHTESGTCKQWINEMF